MPDGLLELIHDCLAKNRDDRPADANAIVERLIDCVPLSMFRLPRADGAPSTGQSLTGRITGIHAPQNVASLTASTPAMRTDSRSPLADAAGPSGSHLPLEPPPAKSKLPLVLAGVGAVALIAGVIAFAGGGKEEDTAAAATPVAAAKPAKGDDLSIPDLLAGAKADFAGDSFDDALAKLDAVEAAGPTPSQKGQADRLRLKVEVGRLMSAAKELEESKDLTAALATYKEVLKQDAANTEARGAISRIEKQLESAKPEQQDGKTGELVVVTVPIAELWIDGKMVGMTPYSGRLPFGPHELSIGADGYLPLKETVTVMPSGNEPLEFTLKRKSSDSPTRKKKSSAPTPAASTDDAPKDPPKKKKETSSDSKKSGPFMSTKKKKSGVFLPVGEN